MDDQNEDYQQFDQQQQDYNGEEQQLVYTNEENPDEEGFYTASPGVNQENFNEEQNVEQFEEQQPDQLNKQQTIKTQKTSKTVKSSKTLKSQKTQKTNKSQKTLKTEKSQKTSKTKKTLQGQDDPDMPNQEQQNDYDDGVANVQNEELELLDLGRRLGLKEKELLDTFILNEERLRALMPNQETLRLPASDLYVFKNKADDIIGVELDSFIEYLVFQYSKKITKYAYTFNEIKTTYMQWLDWSYHERNRDLALEQKEQEDYELAHEDERKKKQDDKEQFEFRRKVSLDILNFKLKKHKIKIDGIFKRYSDQQTDHGIELIRIDFLRDIFHDFSFICGMVLCTYKEFVSTNNYAGYKDSSPRFIETFQHFLWKYIHFSKLPTTQLQEQVIIDENGQEIVQEKIIKPILKPESQEGYFDQRNEEGERRLRFEDECEHQERDFTLFDWKTFKHKLREFLSTKKIIVVDLVEEYSKKLKKLEMQQKASNASVIQNNSTAAPQIQHSQLNLHNIHSSPSIIANDLRSGLLKTIMEYEQMLRNAEDEQQKQKIDKIILQLRRELQRLDREQKGSFVKTDQSEGDYTDREKQQHALYDNNISIADYAQESQDRQEAMSNNNLEDERENASLYKRNKAIHDIFYFYARQHIKQSTNFIDKQEKFQKVELGEFLKFIKDFEITNKEHGIPKTQLIDIFKKVSYCHMPLDIEQFRQALQRISDDINKRKIEETKEALSKTEKDLEKERETKKFREEEHIRYLNDRDGEGNYQRYSEEEKKQQRRRERDLVESKDSLEKTLKILTNKKPENCLDDLYRYMQLDDFNTYRKKIKGYCLAFSIKDKTKDEEGLKYKVRYKKIPFAEVKKVVQDIKEKREKERQQKALDANQKYMKQMKYIEATHDRLRQERLKRMLEERKHKQLKPSIPSHIVNPLLKGQKGEKDEDFNPSSYLEIKNHKQGAAPIEGRNLKVTLDILTKMHYQDFNSAGDKSHQFNPLELIQTDENDMNSPGDMPGNQDEEGSMNGSYEEEDIVVDDFTRKRMPKPEDFFVNQTENVIRKLARKPSLINNYSEKILSLKNQSTAPQNHLVLDEYGHDNQQHHHQQQLGAGDYHSGNISKSIQSLQSKTNTHRNQQSYDLQGPQSSKFAPSNMNSNLGGGVGGRYIGDNLGSGPVNYMSPQNQLGGGMGKSTFDVSNRAMNRNASQTNIIKASQLDLKNKDKMDAIMRMHDKQIQKGMNVLRK